MNQDPQQPDNTSIFFHLIHTEAPDFRIYEYSYYQGVYSFYGMPHSDPKDVLKRLWVPISSMGYDLEMNYELGEYVLVISPLVHKHESIRINVILACITVVTTMFVGSKMFGADPFANSSDILKGLPFTAAIMFVLGSHEMGHYIVARLHGMRTSLPYFIPFPSIIGTMGAVIKNRGPIPSRKALFDVGAAGPIVGLLASVLVTIIGLSLPAVDISFLKLSLPILFMFIGDRVGGMGSVMHPVAFAGWVGMLVTMLNLIPAGQLDGGHILRAMLGPRAVYVSALMPFILMSLALFIYFVMQQNGVMWMFWGLFIALFAASGHPEPIDDLDGIGRVRMVVGVLIFAAGLLCATITPIQM